MFRQVKYSETSLVVKIYTEAYGLRSFIVKGARGKRSRIKTALLQQLSVLELVVSMKEKSELHFIKEARNMLPLRNIPLDIRKSSILLFMDELLYKSIQEETANEELYKYIYDSIQLLDNTNSPLADFPLLFAIHLTGYLGFFPQGIYNDPEMVFDMQEGRFEKSSQAPPSLILRGNDCKYLYQAMNSGFKDLDTLKIPSDQRRDLLQNVLNYYSLHLPSAKEFKSHKILHEVLA